MNECTHIGLYVHKDTIAVAMPPPGTAVVDERVIPSAPEAVRLLLQRFPDPTPHDAPGMLRGQPAYSTDAGHRST